MTPKQLLEKHNGDPLAAASDEQGLTDLVRKNPEEINFALLRAFLHPRPMIAIAVATTIAHLGEDGAEKWGRALWAVVLWAGLDTRFTFAEFWELYKRFNALHLDGFTQITRIANATDRERLAACVVALAEVEK